jgi:hypothetical protein
LKGKCSHREHIKGDIGDTTRLVYGYRMNTDHKVPNDAGDCCICCEILTQNNFALFKGLNENEWKLSPYCCDCIDNYFIAKQWKMYLNIIHSCDDSRSLFRLLSHSPPLNVYDTVFKSDSNPRGEVQVFWYAKTNGEVSSKLQGAPEGQERMDLWNELRQEYKEVIDEYLKENSQQL